MQHYVKYCVLQSTEQGPLSGSGMPSKNVIQYNDRKDKEGVAWW